jgi:hypothetical protein
VGIRPVTHSNCFALSMASRAISGDVRAGAGEVIGNGFQVVGAAKEGADLIVNALIVFHQSVKFAVDARVGFVSAPARFEDQRLGRVKPGGDRRCGRQLRGG